jgi:arginine exporter protein ArgO
VLPPHDNRRALSNVYRKRKTQESSMKPLALIAGVVLLLLGIAGFTGMLPVLPMYNAVLAVAGVLFIMFGLTHRRALVPPRGPGSDLRDLGV